jgi:hypothetical protein
LVEKKILLQNKNPFKRSAMGHIGRDLAKENKIFRNISSIYSNFKIA